MKKKYPILIISIAIYVIGYIIIKRFFTQGEPMNSYTASWLVHGNRYFLFVWVGSILFAIFNKPITSLATTVGCFVGITLGDVIGNHLQELRIAEYEEAIAQGIEGAEAYVMYKPYIHYGIIPIWFSVMIVTLVVGLFFDRRRIKTQQRSL